jgi:hypothetical protein
MKSLKAQFKTVLMTHALVEPLVPPILTDAVFRGSLMTSRLKGTIHLPREMTILRRPKSVQYRPSLLERGQDEVNASNHESEDIEKSNEYEDGGWHANRWQEEECEALQGRAST